MMQTPHQNENPGAGTPGIQPQSKISHTKINNSNTDAQLLLRDALWEVAAILAGCGACAMVAASGGSLAEIEAALQSSRIALIESISIFKQLREIEVAR
jgi:hypothetical protein